MSAVRGDELRPRTAAFLFWDTVGSTAMLSALGDEGAERVRRRLMAAVREVVGANRGEEVKNTGDGMMVAFRSSLTDSLSCAVGIQRAVAALNQHSGQVPVAVRIGVSAGDAVLDWGEGDWFGRVVNTAARLCDAAPNGQIFATRSLGEMADWTVEPVGPLSLKGLDAPVDVVGVSWLAPDGPAMFPLPPILQRGEGLRFVGRDQQLRQLDDLWARTRAHGAQLARVGGALGCGKTRLVAEWIHRLGQDESVALAASCQGRALIEAIGQAVDWHAAMVDLEALTAAAGEDASLIATVAPSVAGRCSVVPDRNAEPEAVEAAVARFVKALAAVIPIVLVMDDAAALARQELEQFVRLLGECAVLTIALCARDRLDGDFEVFVPPLSQDEVELLVARFANVSRQAVRPMARAVLDATAGVPLEVTELISTLAAENLEALTTQDVEAAATSAVTLSSPFRGLKSLREADHALFFGREAALGALIGAVNRSKFVVVTGASGSGKSSLIAAGLVPTVLLGAVADSRSWKVAEFTPGPDPTRALTDALVAAGGEDHGADPADLLGTVPADRILIVVDQLEEMWTHAVQSDDSVRFVELLTGLAVHDRIDVRIVAGLRSDFFPLALQHPGLRTVLQGEQVLLGPLSPDELRRVVEGPAEVTGFRLEEGLTERLIADVAGEAGALPLLSHALYETWRRRDGRALTIAGYEASGGIGGAISTTAEQIVDKFGAAELEQARHLFSRLVTLGEGRADARRRLNTAELGNATHAVAAQFVDARLLTAGDHTLEVAHEALLQQWPRLRSWLDDDRDDLRLRRHLTEASAAWSSSSRDDGDLYRGARLAESLDLARRRPDLLNPMEQSFLDASREEQNAELKAARRRRGLKRATFVGVSCLLAVSLVAGVVAAVQWARADRRREEAELASLVSRASQLAGTNSRVALELAAEAYRRSPGVPSQQALLTVLVAQQGVAASPPTPVPSNGCDGLNWIDERSSAAVYAEGSSILEMDLESARVRDIAERPTACSAVAVSRGATTMAAAWEGNQVWATADLASFGPPRAFPQPVIDVTTEAGSTPSVLVRTSDRPDERADAFVVRADRSVTPLDVAGAASLAVPVPDHDLAAVVSFTSSDDRIRGPGFFWLLDQQTGARVLEVPLDVNAAAVTVSRDGRRAMVATREAELVLVDVEARQVTSRFLTGQEHVDDVVLSPDGSMAAVRGGGVVVVYDTETGEANGSRFDFDNVAAHQYLADGRLVFVDDAAGIKVVSSDVSPVTEFVVPTPNVTRVDLSEDGLTAAAVDTTAGEIIRMDLETGDTERFGSSTSTDSPILAAIPIDGAVTIGIKGDLGVVRWVRGVLDDEIRLTEDTDSLVIGGSGTGEYAAVVARNRELPIYTVASVDMGALRPHAEPVVIDYRDAAPGDVEIPIPIPRPSGGFIVVDATRNFVVFYDERSRVEARVPYTGGTINDLSVYENGDALAFIEADGTLSVVGVRDKEAQPFGTSANASSIEVSPDGERALVVATDGQVDLWDVASATDLGTIWNGSGALAGEPRWSADARFASIATPGSAIRLRLDPDDWLDAACELLGTPLSAAEWRASAPLGLARPDGCTSGRPNS